MGEVWVLLVFGFVVLYLWIFVGNFGGWGSDGELDGVGIVVFLGGGIEDVICVVILLLGLVRLWCFFFFRYFVGFLEDVLVVVGLDYGGGFIYCIL